MDFYRVFLIAAFAFTVMSAKAQNTNWTEHMSTLSPDTLPSKARQDAGGKAPDVVDLGYGKTDGRIVGRFDSNGVDTAHQVILLIGDSMLDGLGSRFVDYAAQNGDEFHTVIWYGSNSMHWANNRDLEYHINRVHPTFIIMALGTNDLGYSDYTRREGWIRKVIKKFGSIPFIWIGPLPISRRGMTNRKIVSIIKNCVGEGRFYDSSNIVCARLDGVHPTYAGAAKWVDGIARWMSTPGLTSHPIRMDYPQRKVRFRADEKHTLKYHGRK